MTDTQATFFATLIDEWVRAGITDAVVCPGNRSTLLSVSLEADSRIRVHVIVDERSASYFALGLGKALGRPAVFWCTSGTATAQAHSAVIEAHYAQVPLLVCTANRPPETQHVRDWQSIDQTALYSGMTRWQFTPGVASDEMRASWRSIASRSVAETMFNPLGPGPVHLDLAIREPWSREIGDLPPGRDDNAPWHQHLTARNAPPALPATHVESLAGKRGIFVVGESDVDVTKLYAAAAALGWPVFAEARSRARGPHDHCVTAYDGIVRANLEPPELVVRIGTPPISKALASWIARSEEWIVDPYDVWTGSKAQSSSVVQTHPTAFCAAVLDCAPKPAPPDWLEFWQAAETLAQGAIETTLAAYPTPTEPAVARAVASETDPGMALFAATSMPIRDVEAFSTAKLSAHVFANRGASGMEGMISTAAGIALAGGRPTILLTGDLSFLYDLNALWALPSVNLTIVVVDNNGGGIFSTLPQLGDIEPAAFERVVATPHNVDIPNVAESLGVTAEDVEEMSELMPALHRALKSRGLRLIYVHTDRGENAKLHQDLNAAIASAISALL